MNRQAGPTRSTSAGRRVYHHVMAVVASAGIGLLAATGVQAQCGAGSAIAEADADCLTASVRNNHPESGRYHYEVTSGCAALGEVVAQATIQGLVPAHDAISRHWLTNDGAEVRTGPGKVTKVECCTDGPWICSRADAVNTDTCDTRFEATGAAASCAVSADALSGGTGAEQCEMSGWCNNDAGVLTRTAITVAWTDVGSVVLCDGTLKLTRC